MNKSIFALSLLWLFPQTLGCRVPVLDPARNIVDGVPVLGSNVCCPPEAYPDAGVILGKADLRRYGPQVVCKADACSQLVSWHDGPDCDGRWLVVERLIGRKRKTHCTPFQLAPFCNTCPSSVYGPTRCKHYDDSILESAFVFFTLDDSETLDGLRVRDVDIVAFNGIGFAVYFDGSDVGLSELEIDAFCILDADHIVMSFAKDFTVDIQHALPGISGDIDNSDLLLFSANSLGPITRGTFSMYVDGSDIELNENSENIDAVAVSDDGRIIFSTSGTMKTDDVSGTESDLFMLLPEQLGDETRGLVTQYFNVSDIEEESSPLEDVNAIDIDESGRIFLSLDSDYRSEAISGNSSDVFQFVPSKVGTKTEGEFVPHALLRGSDFGVTDNDIIAMDFVGVPHLFDVDPNDEEKNQDKGGGKEKDEDEREDRDDEEVKDENEDNDSIEGQGVVDK